MSACVHLGCGRLADTGKWCQQCYTDLIERDIRILAAQPMEYLAAQLVQIKRQVEFLVDQHPELMAFCATCGHLLQVHSWDGCHGVVAGGNHYTLPDSACVCREWNPRE